MGIKLEVGKRYVKRNGRLTDKMGWDGHKMYPFTDGCENWTGDGKFWEDRSESTSDIVAEYKEEEPTPSKQDLISALNDALSTAKSIAALLEKMNG